MGFRRKRTIPGNTTVKAAPVFGYDPKGRHRDAAISTHGTLALTGADQRDRRSPKTGYFVGRTLPLQVFAGVGSVGNAMNVRPDPQTTTKSVPSGMPSVMDQLEALREVYGDRLGRPTELYTPQMRTILDRWRVR